MNPNLNANPSSDAPAVNTLTQVLPTFTLEFLSSPRIVVYTLTDADFKTIDSWAETVGQVTREWPTGSTVRALHDFSARRAGITSYLRQRATQLYTQNTIQRDYLAIVTRDSLWIQTVKLFLRAMPTRLETRLFFTRKDGLDWLINRPDIQPASVP